MSYKRDKAIANEVGMGDVGYTPELMCAANGCPNRWSIDAGRGRLCSAHYAAEDMPHAWPQITQQERDMEVMRAQRGPNPPVKPVTFEQKRAILGKLQALVNRHRDDSGNRIWAEDLRHREKTHAGVLESGQKMTKAQRDMWRAALEERVA